MSYTVLARKWRPKSFQDMVGQEHILQIMSNTLNKQRIHHAYLFCGTRGVGKTTLARIFAKCLNCETGTSSTPCNTCDTCKNIDTGNFIDLIEIDAASRTKVEDTRELLDNVQYAPTAGRFKVYLIDEVHMLSGHSFNALLKTLEEPPEHVKFLLATTDPQKLPITVLSRCLKLQLNMLSETQIATHLEHILKQENIIFESEALQQIATAARGSMRDALSILDQAIVFCDSTINHSGVQQMLGLVDKTQLWSLLTALNEGDTATLFSTIQTMSMHGENFIKAAEAMLTALYQIALMQTAPEALPTSTCDIDQIRQIAKTMPEQKTQLYYQIILVGKKDIGLAPSPQIGFEMLMLRLLAFEPGKMTTTPDMATTQHAKPSDTINMQRKHEINADNWHNCVKELKISGATAIIASHCKVGKMTSDTLELCLSEAHKALCNEKHRQLLEEAISEFLGKRTMLTITISDEQNQETPKERQNREQSQKQQSAKSSLEKDQNIKEMMQMFDASIDPASITTDN